MEMSLASAIVVSRVYGTSMATNWKHPSLYFPFHRNFIVLIKNTNTPIKWYSIT